MLMMLAGRLVLAKGRPADAHDAGWGGWSVPRAGQLMLMMLAWAAGPCKGQAS